MVLISSGKAYIEIIAMQHSEWILTSVTAERIFN